MRLPGLAIQSKCHVARAAAEIQNPGIWPGKDMSKNPRHPAPPQSVYIEGQEMIEQVVARRDGGEHLADSAGCSLGIPSAFRRSANYVGFGVAAQV